MGNCLKDQEVYYDFGIKGFLRFHLDWGSKV
jgi:hypothetical protein